MIALDDTMDLGAQWLCVRVPDDDDFWLRHLTVSRLLRLLGLVNTKLALLGFL
jgi:hypothetical protein